MPVRGAGIRDIADIENISLKKSVVGIGTFPAYDPVPDIGIMIVWKRMSFGLM
jgi:hypothetical protein